MSIPKPELSIMFKSFLLGTCSIVLLLLWSCQSQESVNPFYKGVADIQERKAFLMEITNPAGTSSTNTFLPYPANHGLFTENSEVEVLAITNRLDSGQQVAVYPVGTLILQEGATKRNIIISVPIDSSLQFSPIVNFQEFIVTQAGARQIIQDWFLYEKGLGVVDLVGWKDEQYAWSLLNE